MLRAIYSIMKCQFDSKVSYAPTQGRGRGCIYQAERSTAHARNHIDDSTFCREDFFVTCLDVSICCCVFLCALMFQFFRGWMLRASCSRIKQLALLAREEDHEPAGRKKKKILEIVANPDEAAAAAELELAQGNVFQVGHQRAHARTNTSTHTKMCGWLACKFISCAQ